MNRRQTIPKHLRYTVTDFNMEFPNDDACLEYIKERRFPAGITHCEKCDKDRKHHRVSGRTAYACDHCGNHIYPLAGTIFEKSTTSLRLWFYAMYLMGSTRCGISAKQIQRETGVTYKTAWRMFRQIRSLLGDDLKLEGSSVEMDESYFGAKRKRGNKRGRPSPNDSTKTCVVGVVEREGRGRVYATVASDATKKTLHGIALERIMPESTIFTDEYYSYNGLDQQGYTHRRINHSAGVYVMADGTHTNTIEGFWSLVKRGIGGVYHQVSRKYLQTYLDEYSFRYNRRTMGNLIFRSILERVSEKAA
jgi:transposase-like protein